MAKRTDYRELAEAIVEGSKYCSSENNLVKWVQDNRGYAVGSNDTRVRTAIRTLVSSGRLGGRLGYGDKAMDITYREIPTDDDTMRDVVNDLRRALEETKSEADKSATENEQLKKENEQLKKAVEEKNATVKTIRIVHPDKKVVKMEEMVHEKFERALQLASARKNIFLYGPTGCGKSHICEQLAKALRLKFYFVSCTAGMSEGHLTGRLLPVGKSGTFEYVMGDYVKAYETGGVFLLDEMDAADPNVLLVVNASLANGHMAVSNRPAKPYAKRHKDFVCIAAANTVGTGADRQYSGRNQLDAATLDRFLIGKIRMDYDARIEKRLCPDDNLRERLLRYRQAVMDHRLERAVSTRFMRDAYDMVQQGWTYADVDEALFLGWRTDEINKVRGY